MQNDQRRTSLLVVTMIFCALCITSGRAGAQEKVLHDFSNNGMDGSSPLAGLTLDASGHLYGTTGGGGAEHFGIVFELIPRASGNWNERVLFHFHSTGSGISPFAGLTVDGSGNLYGTTAESGNSAKGVAFELRRWPDGNWTQEVLHHYGAPGDAAYPRGNMISDVAGKLYGTTADGGAYGGGTVFELTRSASGTWTERVLHSFGHGSDGYAPTGALVFDSSGTLYGATTGTGSQHTAGTVFEMDPKGDGTWSEKLLYNFEKGRIPSSGVILDASGNLYGETTVLVRTGSNLGTVFELTPAAGGSWTQTVLHTFGGRGDGSHPRGGLIFDAAGNLYGTTEEGGAFGANGGDGTVFKLSQSAEGGWREKIVHSFGQGKDGALPEGGLILNPSGHLFGTTFLGGVYGFGTVFEITP